MTKFAYISLKKTIRFMAINQSLQLKLQQKLSPMQIQLVKLLEIPTAQMEQRIKEEIEANPVLEVDEDAMRRNNDEVPEPQVNAAQDQQPDDGTIEGYLLNEDIPAYKMQANNYSDDDDRRERVPVSEASSFYEHLEEQVGLHDLSPRQEQIASYIIGNIDEDGYLRRDVQNIADDVSFAINEDVSDAEVTEVLDIVQQFDPSGVGARDLRECLLLQLHKARDPQQPDIQLAIEVLDKCFEEFSQHHYDKVMRKLHITDDQLKQATAIIVRLNPKPGSAYGGGLVRQAQHVVPDFIVDYEDGKISFHLNRKGEPELMISRTYADMLREYNSNKSNLSNEQRDAATFVKEKVKSAQWFIDAIKQRHNTLRLVMQSIIDYQGDYFIDGDERKLKPMILKDIADRTGLDVSTISRVSNSKYVQTPFGIYPLKYFFTEALQNADGDDVSTREVKKILREAIDAEDKRHPLTDERLVEILREKSYQIARRTVAKYREQMGIAVARLRKTI